VIFYKKGAVSIGCSFFVRLRKVVSPTDGLTMALSNLSLLSLGGNYRTPAIFWKKHSFSVSEIKCWGSLPVRFRCLL